MNTTTLLSPQKVLEQYYVGKKIVSREFYDDELLDMDDDPVPVGTVITGVSLGTDDDNDAIIRFAYDCRTDDPEDDWSWTCYIEIFDNESIDVVADD